MKKMTLLLALFLSSMSLTVKADFYTDGMKQILTEGFSAYDPGELESALRQAGINEETLSVNDIIDVTAELMGTYYKKYFTDEQFAQYMDFCSQPEMSALIKKNAKFTKSYKEQLQTFLTSAMLQMRLGNFPSNVKAERCSKAYKADFERFWDYNNMDYAMTTLTDVLDKSTEGQNADTKALIQRLISYIEKNLPVFTRNSLTNVMDEKELHTYLTITEQPFSEPLSKVGKVFSEGLTDFTKELQDKLTVKIYTKLYGPIDNISEETKPTIANDETEDKSNNEPEEIDEPVFLVVEKMAQFPGGQSALNEYVKSHLRYPESCYNVKIEGRAIIQFIVEKDGSISTITVARSSGSKDLDNEAVRLVRQMPNWVPGEQRGKLVRCKFTLPINFRIADVQK